MGVCDWILTSKWKSLNSHSLCKRICDFISNGAEFGNESLGSKVVLFTISYRPSDSSSGIGPLSKE